MNILYVLFFLIDWNFFIFFILNFMVVELIEDDVYFLDVSKLDEYVLNDSGVIFNGDVKYVG